MAAERFPHIFIAGPSDTIPFTSRAARGAEARFPARDRAGHAARLHASFEVAWAAAESRRAVAQVDRHGVYLEFQSSPGFDLILKSLENLGLGIRLLNVRRRLVGEEVQTLATVFVPESKRGYFLGKIEDYASSDLASGKPKNANLINGISDVKAAVVESFWRSVDLDRIPGVEREWIELWVRTDDAGTISSVGSLLKVMGIEASEGILEFPERAVQLILANRTDVETLLRDCDWVAEFRPCASIASDVLRLDNRDQVEVVRRLLERSTFDAESHVAVCLLDTGVNNGHPLLAPLLDDADLHTVREEWGTDDREGHGTLMAGTAGYGNLLIAIDSQRPLHINHVLESAKILPPGQRNPKKLWGSVTIEGVSRAEIQAPRRRRVICLAVTSDEDGNRGCPSSWSAAIDELTSGFSDDGRRLVVVSAGNTEYATWRDYPNSNETDEVHDPGQAWNALTVGAHTRLVRINDPKLSEYEAVAPAEALSPHSTTSLNWSAVKWPIKPEVLFEGGNVARGPDGFITQCDDLELISTSRDPQVSQFAPFGQTSAAAAQAAELAARLQVAYPDAWPETIRGLIVHSAEWTDAMQEQFPADSKREYARRARVCGYGVPDSDRAVSCMRNSLTLVSQAVLQPYEIRNGNPATKDMHFYSLPWPTEVLEELGNVPVEMRVTLSYFVEPSPGEIGWQDRYRYASHGLRFEVNAPGESEAEFIQRINTQAREDGTSPGTIGPRDHWTLGSKARDVGSIHSDIWKGSAADLAASNRIAVYPVIGWWRERKSQGRLERQSHYALIVSIRTPSEDVDIYTPVAVQIGIPIQIPAT